MKDELFKAIRGKCISDESARAVIEEVEKFYSTGENEDVETNLLDAINAGLRKWGVKEKLSFEDSIDLLTSLQDKIMDVKIPTQTITLTEDDHRTTIGKATPLSGEGQEIYPEDEFQYMRVEDLDEPKLKTVKINNIPEGSKIKFIIDFPKEFVGPWIQEDITVTEDVEYNISLITK